MRVILITNIFLFFGLHQAFNQNKVDSLQNILSQCTSDSAKVVVLIEIAQTQSNNQPKKALQSALKSIELSQNMDNDRLKCESFSSVARAYSELGLYEKSLEYNLKSYELLKEIDDNEFKIVILNNIGNLYTRINNQKTAISFYKEAVSLGEESGLAESLPPALMNIGLAYTHIGFPDSVTHYYRKALELVKKFNNEYGIGIVSYNIGTYHLDKNNFEKANEYFQEAFKKCHFFQLELLANFYSNFALCNLYLGERGKAEQYMDSSKIIARKSQNNLALQKHYLVKYYYDSTLKDYKSALNSYIEYSKLSDSLHKETYASKLAAFETLYELDKKEEDLKNLERTTYISSQKIKSKNIIIILVIVALVLLSFLVMILFSYYKSSKKYAFSLKDKHKHMAKKNTRLLKSEKELKELNDSKNKLFSIIAHDIKSPLYSMLRMADVLIDKYDLHSDEKRKKYLKTLNDSGKELINLIENLLSWSRYQIGNTPFRPNYFPFVEAINFSLGISRHLAEQKQIEIIVNVPESTIVFADFSMTATVIRNIMTNAIKFTHPKGNIEICLTDKLDHVLIEIKDSGIGIDKKILPNIFKIEEKTSGIGTSGEKGTGLGLPLCKEFIEKNKGEIGVQSKIDKGSTFWFKLPKQQKEHGKRN